MIQFYKDKRKTEIQVAVLSIVGIAVLVLGYLWFREALDSREYTLLRVHFPSAATLKPGDAVAVNGYRLGKVKTLTPRTDGVEAVLKVVLEFPLPEGTLFLIKDSNLMGGKIIDILPGKGSKPIDTAAVQVGFTQTGIGDFVAGLEDTMGEVNRLLALLNNQKPLLDRTYGVVDSLGYIVASVRDIMQDNRRNIESTLVNLERGSREAADLVSANRDNVDVAIRDTRALLARLNRSTESLDRIMVSLDSVTTRLDKGDNTVSLLLRERVLYDDLRGAVAGADSLIRDIKRNPSRYINISVF